MLLVKKYFFDLVWPTVHYTRYRLFHFPFKKKESPLIISFKHRVLNAEKNGQLINKILALRQSLQEEKRKIIYSDLGAGGVNSNAPAQKQISVRKLARRVSVSHCYGKFLYRLLSFYQPKHALELGSCIGISTAYQAAALKKGALFSLEGVTGFAEIAKENMQYLGFKNVNIYTGNFDDTLPAVLSQVPSLEYVFFDGNHTEDATLRYFNMCLPYVNTKTVFVFDDIHWSPGMYRAWNKIRTHPSVSVTIDMYRMGICFFHKYTDRAHVYMVY